MFSDRPAGSRPAGEQYAEDCAGAGRTSPAPAPPSGQPSDEAELALDRSEWSSPSHPPRSQAMIRQKVGQDLDALDRASRHGASLEGEWIWIFWLFAAPLDDASGGYLASSGRLSDIVKEGTGGRCSARATKWICQRSPGAERRAGRRRDRLHQRARAPASRRPRRADGKPRKLSDRRRVVVRQARTLSCAELRRAGIETLPRRSQQRESPKRSTRSPVEHRAAPRPSRRRTTRAPARSAASERPSSLRASAPRW